LSDHPVHVPDLAPERTYGRLLSLLAPLERVVQPRFHGLDELPESGTMLVGNHTVLGLLDLPFMMAALWKRRRIVVRGLGEHAHYAFPVWRDLLAQGGMVRGTRDNVRALMREKQNIVVFPGGAREVNKRRGERYRLMWKERLGFARLAIEHGYPIVPFAAIGAEEMFDVVIDANNPLFKRIASAIEGTTHLPLLPVVRGVGPTPIPRPERLYFWFGPPIETTRFVGREADVAAARALRNQVRSGVESGIEFLLQEREHDQNRSLAKRLLHRVEE
jgi:1-acyl-sn-glycerol-3-phosphate acyltransferase